MCSECNKIRSPCDNCKHDDSSLGTDNKLMLCIISSARYCIFNHLSQSVAIRKSNFVTCFYNSTPLTNFSRKLKMPSKWSFLYAMETMDAFTIYFMDLSVEQIFSVSWISRNFNIERVYVVYLKCYIRKLVIWPNIRFVRWN